MQLDRFFDDLKLVKTVKGLEVFGELNLYDKFPKTCTLICKGDVIMASLQQEDFKAIISEWCNNSEIQMRRIFPKTLEQRFQLLDKS